MCHPDGIYLYHIPELKSWDNHSILSPAWAWFGKSTQYHGSVYDIPSKFPKLHIQGSQNMHQLEFSLESGFLVVLRHNATKEPPAYCIRDEKWRAVLKGRKWAFYYAPSAPSSTQILVSTILLGREGRMGAFSIFASGSSNGQQEVHQ